MSATEGSASIGPYDEGYKACSCFWGTQPSSYVRKLKERLGNLSGLKVLDAGCGEGKNSVYLASFGATVKAYDISAHALTNARTNWGTPNNISWELGDVTRAPIESELYDIVVMYGLLHCLASKASIENLILRMQKSVRPGGYHVVCCFNSRSQDLSAHPGFSPCLLDHSDYLSFYSTWTILEESDSDISETHPNNNILHTHSLTRILSKKAVADGLPS